MAWMGWHLGGERIGHIRKMALRCILLRSEFKKESRKELVLKTGLNYRMIELGLAVGCEDICDMCQNSLPVLTDDWTVSL